VRWFSCGSEGTGPSNALEVHDFSKVLSPIAMARTRQNLIHFLTDVVADHLEDRPPPCYKSEVRKTRKTVVALQVCQPSIHPALEAFQN
jgi:hypothetical protein